MCGIIGYTGKHSARDILISGLYSLEYRGYDSSGIAIALNNEIYDLKELDYIEDDSYLYFMVDEDTLDAYTNVNISVRIWTTALNGKLTSSFITRQIAFIPINVYNIN